MIGTAYSIGKFGKDKLSQSKSWGEDWISVPWREGNSAAETDDNARDIILALPCQRFSGQSLRCCLWILDWLHEIDGFLVLHYLYSSERKCRVDFRSWFTNVFLITVSQTETKYPRPDLNFSLGIFFLGDWWFDSVQPFPACLLQGENRSQIMQKLFKRNLSKCISILV